MWPNSNYPFASVRTSKAAHRYAKTTTGAIAHGFRPEIASRKAFAGYTPFETIM
jgi:hypothetical protein